MIKQIQQFFNLSWFEQRLFIIVLFLTGIVRLSILFLPFRWLGPVLGGLMQESQATEEKVNVDKAKQIGKMVERVSRYTPWESKCLVQALVGKILLRRQGITNTLYLGVGRDERNALIAHAWLRCGEIILTGGKGRERFTVVSKFADCAAGEETRDFRV
ncbi:lasso peptide biosynthesis B2 protein [Sporomusa sp. KB1]|uniref:lasso peptide biosynthesis B2 protein n=1 Tax=Sporomusa sp. KB1 TaxID=943346 RepID=UPI0011A91AB1|nr:lasso peptide biosynthesis B2 protein [Sporomusa sp. KB1]TWH49431.1 transglutaminase superfamily protein [Sporomusa sp. KB1]